VGESGREWESEKVMETGERECERV
jgi:hypothetical protein